LLAGGGRSPGTRRVNHFLRIGSGFRGRPVGFGAGVESRQPTFQRCGR
jgi:hypothetical protein